MRKSIGEFGEYLYTVCQPHEFRGPSLGGSGCFPMYFFEDPEDARFKKDLGFGAVIVRVPLTSFYRHGLDPIYFKSVMEGIWENRSHVLLGELSFMDRSSDSEWKRVVQ